MMKAMSIPRVRLRLIINTVVVAVGVSLYLTWGLHMTPLAATITGVVFAMFVGGYIAWGAGKAVPPVQREMDRAPSSLRTRAAKVASRGPAPDDPDLRAAALHIATLRVGLVRRWWRRQMLSLVLLVPLCGWMAMTSSSWWWLAAAMAVPSGVALLLRRPAYFERRVQILEIAPEPAVA